MFNSTKIRAVLSSLLIATFMAVTFTGIGLWLAPSGRVAREMGWNFFGLDKWILENLHTLLGFSLSFLVVVHFILNFRLYVNELKCFRSLRK